MSPTESSPQSSETGASAADTQATPPEPSSTAAIHYVSITLPRLPASSEPSPPSLVTHPSHSPRIPTPTPHTFLIESPSPDASSGIPADTGSTASSRSLQQPLPLSTVSVPTSPIATSEAAAPTTAASHAASITSATSHSSPQSASDRTVPLSQGTPTISELLPYSNVGSTGYSNIEYQFAPSSLTYQVPPFSPSPPPLLTQSPNVQFSSAASPHVQYHSDVLPLLLALSRRSTDADIHASTHAVVLPSVTPSDLLHLPPSEPQSFAAPSNQEERSASWSSPGAAPPLTSANSETLAQTAASPQTDLIPPSIDQAFIKIPLECNLRVFKNFQRQIEKEMSVICNFLEKKILQETDRKGLLARLSTVLEKLEGIYQRTEVSQKEAELYFHRCIIRLNTIISETNIQVEQSKNDFKFSDYNLRINWILHEYFLRRGFVQTAEALVQVEELQGLVDTSVYEISNTIIRSLRNHETKIALEWCAAHRARLNKLGSTLEAQLHLQHMLGLLVEEKYHEAVNYIRMNVTAVDFENCKDMKRAMALLAARNDPPSNYRDLFCDSRWEKLEKLFEDVCSKIHYYPTVPSIELVLQAGLSALKSQICHDHKSISCPVCLPEWMSYTSELPSPHRVQSCLICPISGEVMDAENPPLVSPDGRVFSQSALESLASSSADGMVECPFTKKRYKLDRFRKMFVT